MFLFCLQGYMGIQKNFALAEGRIRIHFSAFAPLHLRPPSLS